MTKLFNSEWKKDREKLTEEERNKFHDLGQKYYQMGREVGYKKGSENEIVICAAIRMPDGYIIRGHRHNDAIRTGRGIPRYEGIHTGGDDHGFVTSRNRYVTRKEGYELQIAAGIQSVDNIHPYLGGELYSEDLY